MSSLVFQWFSPIFFTWYLGQETVDAEAPRLLKAQSHFWWVLSIYTRQKDSCLQGERPPPLDRSSGTWAQGGKELLVRVCVDSLTQACTRAHTPSHELQHSLLLTQGSRWALASAAGPPWSLHWVPKDTHRGKCERKGLEVKQTNKLLSVEPRRQGAEGYFRRCAVLWWPTLLHLFLPLNLCPGHPSRITALPWAQYHVLPLL